VLLFDAESVVLIDIVTWRSSPCTSTLIWTKPKGELSSLYEPTCEAKAS
jgi:hypothetical protein